MSRSNGLVTRGIVVLTSILGSSAAHAAELHVPSQYPNIQAALTAATGGDEVVLAAGTYTGTNNRDLRLAGKPVLVRSSNPKDPAVVAATVIDCQASAASPRKAFTLDCSSAANEAGLAGLTITGAHDLEGAVVCDFYSTPVIRDCVIRDNDTSGIACRANSAARILDCRIENNVTGGDGGGISLAIEGSPVIDRCVIRGNNAALGGGIYVNKGWPEVSNCEISGNYATDGGGVWLSDSGVSLAGCTVAGNSAQQGGGVYALSNIYFDKSSVRNSVIWGNVSPDNRQVALAVSPVGQHTDTLTVSYTLVQGGQPAAAGGWIVNWGSGNLAGNASPAFVSAGGADGQWNTWQDNDYHLGAGSVCVDAGDPAGSYAGQTDVAGQPRLVGAKVDLGAYEAAGAQPIGLVGDLDGDGHVDVTDLMTFGAAFGKVVGQAGYSAACDFDGDGSVDVTDLMMLAENWGV